MSEYTHQRKKLSLKDENGQLELKVKLVSKAAREIDYILHSLAEQAASKAFEIGFILADLIENVKPVIEKALLMEVAQQLEYPLTYKTLHNHLTAARRVWGAPDWIWDSEVSRAKLYLICLRCNSPDEIERWVETCLEEGLTYRQLKERLKRKRSGAARPKPLCVLCEFPLEWNVKGVEWDFFPLCSDCLSKLAVKFKRAT